LKGRKGGISASMVRFITGYGSESLNPGEEET